MSVPDLERVTIGLCWLAISGRMSESLGSMVIWGWFLRIVPLGVSIF